MLAVPIAKDLGIATSSVFFAFSFSLVVSAFLGPYAGKSIDRWGGRPVLMATNLVFALGLILLGTSQSTTSLFIAWAILGIGMGCGLYEAAFASLVRIYGNDARGAITGITLLAGFASTVGWPLSTFFETNIGWRGACFGWAALHLMIALPLNWLLPSANSSVTNVSMTASGPLESTQTSKTLFGSVMLAIVFAVTWFVSTAMAAHLPQLLMAGGATFVVATSVGALIGPAQVGARIMEFGFLRRVHPLLSARLACLMHPVGAVIFTLAGAPAASLFVVLHGAGNGILTIAKGTLPLAIFGPQGYGHRQGLLMVPARFAQALSPWLFGLCIDSWGTGALWISGSLGVVAFAALVALRVEVAKDIPSKQKLT